jgi:hypothetical protein
MRSALSATVSGVLLKAGRDKLLGEPGPTLLLESAYLDITEAGQPALGLGAICIGGALQRIT